MIFFPGKMKSEEFFASVDGFARMFQAVLTRIEAEEAAEEKEAGREGRGEGARGGGKKGKKKAAKGGVKESKEEALDGGNSSSKKSTHSNMVVRAAKGVGNALGVRRGKPAEDKDKPGAQRRARALYAFEASSPTELSIPIGAVVEVLEEVANPGSIDFWKCRLEGREVGYRVEGVEGVKGV